MSTPGKPPLARAESTKSTPIKEMAAKLGSPAPVQTPPPLNRPASHSRTPSGNTPTTSSGSPVTTQTPPPLGRPASLSRTPSGSFSATPQRPGSASASKPVESKLATPVQTPEKKDFTTVDVVCSKCIDLATDPVMSKCGHTYCRACFPLARGPCIRHGCHPKLAELCSAHPNLLKKVTGFQSGREGFLRAAKDQIPMLWNLNDAEITEKAAKVTEMLKALQASSNKLAADLDKFATLKPDEEKLRNEESGLIHTAKELEVKGHALREREDELRAKRAILEAEAARRREELQKLLEEFSQKKTQINTKEKELQEKDVLPTNETRHLWSNRDRAASLSPMITEADRARKQAEDELRKLDAQFKSDMDTIERELKETQQALVDGAKKMDENKLRLAKLHDRMQVIRVKRAGEAQAAMAAAIRALEDERSTFADSLPPELEPIISLLCQRANWFTPQVSLSRLRSVDFFQLCQHLEQLDSPIEVLDLSGASLRDEHVIVLCEALRRNPAPRLKLLSLSSNPLTDIAACALLDLVSRSPYLSNLQSIVLDNCRDVPQSTGLLLRQQLEMNNALKIHFPAPEGFADPGLRHLFETLIFGKADIIEKYASVRDELALKVEEGLPMGFSKPIPPAWTNPSKDKEKPPMTRASTKSLSN